MSQTISESIKELEMFVKENQKQQKAPKTGEMFREEKLKQQKESLRNVSLFVTFY